MSVIRSAECWTNHKLLRAVFKIKRPTRVKNQCKQKKFAVSALANDKNRAKYIEAVVEGIEASWCSDDDAECCLLYTSPSPRDATLSRMPSSA